MDDSTLSDPPPGVSLGTNAKSSTPPPVERLRKAARALRYQALSEARHLLVTAARVIDPTIYPNKIFRTAGCRWATGVQGGQVGVLQDVAHGSAHFGGLVTCASVWACPVCAAKIQERRRLEIEQAMAWAARVGLGALLVTFTFPHKAWHRLADLLAAQAEAFRFLRSGSPWSRLKSSINFQGLIRSLEVTHGLNGFHPHTHELWFVDPSVGSSLLARLLPLWERACIRAGLLDPSDPDQVAAFRCHAVDVRADVTAGDYLAKQDDSRAWGFSHEVAKATSKVGRAKGVHPHRFLIRREPGDAALYLEYVQGMKGRRQLFWSPGLKERVGLLDLTDETLADESRDPAELLGMLDRDDWRLVRGNDAYAEVLDAAESGGWPAVRALLAALA